MKTETLYHTEIGLPSWFKMPGQRVKLDYGNHARQEAMQDRYGQVKLPPILNLRRLKVIEVGVIDGKVSKILFRGHHDKMHDVCFVLIPRGKNPWTVKTVWLNRKDDIHRTLDKARYAAV